MKNHFFLKTCPCENCALDIEAEVELWNEVTVTFVDFVFKRLTLKAESGNFQRYFQYIAQAY